MEATGIEERGVGSGETAALLAERTGRPLSERRGGEGADVGSAVSDSDHSRTLQRLSRTLPPAPLTAGLGFVEVTVDDGVSSETTALLDAWYAPANARLEALLASSDAAVYPRAEGGRLLPPNWS